MSYNPFLGFQVVRYNGDNADAVVKALGIDEGDAVVMMNPPILLKSSDLDELIVKSPPVGGFLPLETEAT